jgi:hypothetical protein
LNNIRKIENLNNIHKIEKSLYPIVSYFISDSGIKAQGACTVFVQKYSLHPSMQGQYFFDANTKEGETGRTASRTVSR